MPAASQLNTSHTVILSPRTHGCPERFPGSIVMRGIIAFEDIIGTTQSTRNDRVGSMREARHAGKAAAAAATPRMKAVTAANVRGSVAVTPNRSVLRERVASR